MKKGFVPGFSLVELLTAITIFLAVTAIIFGAITSLMRYQEQMVVMQGMFNDSSYALEYMGRLMRMARRDAGDDCISLGENYQNPGGDTSNIRFLDYEGNCIGFFLDNEQIKLEFIDPSAPDVALTSSSFTIHDLSFIHNDGDRVQPRVTISFGIRHESMDIGFNLQATTSQRNLNL